MLILAGCYYVLMSIQSNPRLPDIYVSTYSLLRFAGISARIHVGQVYFKENLLRNGCCHTTCPPHRSTVNISSKSSNDTDLGININDNNGANLDNILPQS
jgi:hypothetical protein